MTVRWTRTAKNDLHAIWDYIARDSVYYADNFISELLSATDMFEVFPEMGRSIHLGKNQDHLQNNLLVFLVKNCFYRIPIKNNKVFIW